VISATRKLNNHAVPVEIAVMGTRALKGAISEAYRNVNPRNPVGKNSENMKMKAPAVPEAARLVIFDDVPAMIAMQMPMPAAENIINLRRPKRSTVSTPIGEQIVCHVNTAAPRILETLLVKPRPCSKTVA
jgi:hypothetical protein